MKTKSIKSLLETDVREALVLQYPLSLTGKSNHLISFGIYTALGSRFSGNGKRKIQNSNNKDNVLELNLDSNILTGGNISPSAYINMYMPDEVTSNGSHTWDRTELGLVSRLGDRTENLMDGNYGESKDSVVEAVKRMGLRGAQGVSDVNFYDVNRKVTQMISNPFMEMMYNGSQQESYSFNFKFMPKNKKESLVVREIINRFRFHAAPEFKNGSDKSFLRYPSLFEPKFIFDGEENTHILQHKLSALIDVNINYAGSGQFSSFDDGSPTEIHMMLQFAELSIKTKEDINW